jgi:hypothetical protein
MIFVKFIMSVRDGHCDYLSRVTKKPSYAIAAGLAMALSCLSIPYPHKQTKIAYYEISKYDNL